MNNPTRKKGPFRTGLLGTLSVVVVLMGLYTYLFLDTHLRWALQWGLGAGNGAEANVRSLTTHLFTPALRIDGIELTDPSTPEQNRVSIGRVEVVLKWDALLRGKVVLEKVSVLDLGLGSPRRSRGWVSPPKESDPNSFSGRISAKLGDAADSSLKRALALLGGFKPMDSIGKIQAKHTMATIEALEKDLKAKQQAWSSGLQSPTPDSLRAMTEGVGTFGRALQSIDEAIAKDRSEIEGLLALPKLDGSQLSKDLLQAPVRREISKSAPWLSQAEPYLKKSSSSGQTPPPPPPRPARGGRKFEFGRPQSYPAFWLKLAEFSGEAEASLRGKVTDVTSDPRSIGRPTQIQLQGEFPRQGVRGFFIRSTLDARSIFEATGEVGATAMSFGDVNLVESPELSLALQKVTGGLAVKGSYRADRGIDLSARLSSQSFESKIQGSSAVASKIVGEALRSTHPLYGQVTVRGNFENPEVGLETNLARALESGLRSYLAKEIEQARAMIDKKLQQEVGDRRAALTRQFESAKAPIEQKVREVQAAAEAAKNKLKNDLGNELKKRLPF